MFQTNIQLDLRKKIKSGLTQSWVTEREVSLSYANHIARDQEQIANKAFVKMKDEINHAVELTHDILERSNIWNRHLQSFRI